MPSLSARPQASATSVQQTCCCGDQGGSVTYAIAAISIRRHRPRMLFLRSRNFLGFCCLRSEHVRRFCTCASCGPLRRAGKTSCDLPHTAPPSPSVVHSFSVSENGGRAWGREGAFSGRQCPPPLHCKARRRPSDSSTSPWSSSRTPSLASTAPSTSLASHPSRSFATPRSRSWASACGQKCAASSCWYSQRGRTTPCNGCAFLPCSASPTRR